MVLYSSVNENRKVKIITHAWQLIPMDYVLPLMMDLITTECDFNPLVSFCTDFED